MSDEIEVESEDLSLLEKDLGKIPLGSKRNLRKAIEVTARKVRDTGRENAPGSVGGSPAAHFPNSITYDIHTRNAFGGWNLEAEIGPDKERRQGALGNLIEYGSRNNAPWGTMHGALQANEADFEKGVETAIDDALRELGL